MGTPMVGTERLELVRIRERFPDAVLGSKEYRGDTWIFLRKEHLVEVAKFLKEDPELEYKYFAECVGADYSTWEFERDLPERFEVVYNLMSLKYHSRLFLKVGANDGEKVPSLKHVWMGAEYPEREVWDLLGVVFEGNEQTERFLLPDDWVGFPLRKEFPLGGEDVLFDQSTRGPAVEDVQMPHAGESFEGKTGSEEVGGR